MALPIRSRNDNARVAKPHPARRLGLLRLVLCALGFTLLLVSPANLRARPRNVKQLPKRYQKAPYNKMSLSVGHPNAGWQRRGMRLKKRPYLHIARSSRKNNYGHPALVKMLYRASRDIARTTPRSVMLVGDLSKKRGGALSGHKSHQSGRDADVAFYARDSHNRISALKKFVAFNGEGKAKDGSGLHFDDKRNWMLVRAWLRDHRASIQYVFVSRPLKRRLLNYARRDKTQRQYVKAAEVFLRQPRHASAHDNHFHVRIGCPKRQSDICMPNPKTR